MQGEDLKVSISRQSDAAVMPVRRSEQSPGYDLFASETSTVEPFESRYVATDWVILIPKGTFARVVSKKPTNPEFSVGSEILECDIQTPLRVYITNKTSGTIVVQMGQEIGFLMIDRVVPINMVEDLQISRYRGVLDSIQTGNSILGESECNYQLYDQPVLLNSSQSEIFLESLQLQNTEELLNRNQKAVQTNLSQSLLCPGCHAKKNRLQSRLLALWTHNFTTSAEHIPIHVYFKFFVHCLTQQRI